MWYSALLIAVKMTGFRINKYKFEQVQGISDVDSTISLGIGLLVSGNHPLKFMHNRSVLRDAFCKYRASRCNVYSCLSLLDALTKLAAMSHY